MKQQILIATGAFLVVVTATTMVRAASESHGSITVAIMAFDAKAPGNPDFGQQIAEILTVRLSMVDSVQVVDRSRLTEILEEQKLKLRGLTDQQQAAEVGKLLGAQIMVFGKVFPVGDELYVTMKLVGVETSLLKGAIAKGKASEDLDAIVERAVEELTQLVESEATALLPPDFAIEPPLTKLEARLSGKTLPTLAIVVPEEHLGRPIPDPAVETEVKRIARKLGFQVRSVDSSVLSGWAGDLRKSDVSWPLGVDEVDLVIIGEGFSEPAGSTRGLVSCSARVELQAIERSSRKIIGAERSTERAVDLSEHIAAKTALQKCGHTAGLALMEQIAEFVEKSE